MSRLTNQEIVHRYVEAFNRCDIEALRDIFAPDAVIHGVLGSGGMETAIPIWRELHAAFEIKLHVQEVITQGEHAAVRYIERGTFKAPFRGKEPTGKSYELTAMEWFVIRDGRIQTRWGARDSAAQARQLGM